MAYRRPPFGLDPPDENPNEPFGGYGQGNIHGRSSLLGSSQAPPPPALPPYRTGGSTALSAVGSSSRDMSFAESREFLENIDEIRHNMNVAWRTQQATYRGDRSIESSNARIEQEIRNARTDIAQARTAEEARDKELLTEIKALRNDIMELKLVLQQQQPLQQRQQQEITSDSAWSGPRNPGSNPLGPGEYTAFNIASADCGQSRGAFRAQGRGQRSRGSRGQCPDHGYFGGGRGTHIHRGRPPPPTTRPARAPPAPVSM